MKDDRKKYQTVIEKNTYYFFDSKAQEDGEAQINSLKESLLVLKNEVETKGLQKEVFERLLLEKENGLNVLLTLTGFSQENFKRLITIIRAAENRELSLLLNKPEWTESGVITDISEWGIEKIQKMVKEHLYFRKGLVNLFFEGATLPFLSHTLPLFELKKLSIEKLCFDFTATLDTLVRYKVKGYNNAKKDNNSEIIIQRILQSYDITFERGDLDKLKQYDSNTKRTMDFIIPSQLHPKIIIECSYLATTSSGMGDKAKTEIAVRQLIKKHYPKSKFIGFIDGIGWYVRKQDLKRMVTAYDDVFTFHPEELLRFEQFLKSKAQ